MSGDTLKVDPQVLHGATVAFGEAADALSRMAVDVPIGDAAIAGGLLTADSCRNAQRGIAAAVTAVVESVRKYGEDLDAAVRAYTQEDESGGSAFADSP
jgi:hypothetical protein